LLLGRYLARTISWNASKKALLLLMLSLLLLLLLLLKNADDKSPLVCRPGLQRMPSLPTKHALYTFLQGLLTDNPTLVPPTDTPAPLSSTHFQNGPLQTGSQVALDRSSTPACSSTAALRSIFICVSSIAFHLCAQTFDDLASQPVCLLTCVIMLTRLEAILPQLEAILPLEPRLPPA